MKYRIIAALLLVYASSFFQASPFASLQIFGVRLLLPLSLAVVTGLLRTPFESVLMGLLYGLSMDMLTGRALGIYTVLYGLIAGCFALFNEKIYRERILIRFFFGFIATVATETVYFLIIFLFRGYADFGVIFMQFIFPVALLNGL